MKSFVAFFALVAVVVADVSHIVAHTDRDAHIVSQSGDVGPENFEYGFETSNGISARESGQLRLVGNDAALVVEGSNAYTAPGGEPIQLTYVADENGYQPQGAHLPTPPPPQPIPEYIARAIEYIRAHPPKPESKF